MQQIVGTPVIGLLALTLMGCAEDHLLSKTDASKFETDASMRETDASTHEPDASTHETDAAKPTNDATLASLSLVYANGELTYPQAPEFYPDAYPYPTYTIDVGLWLNEIEVIVTPNDTAASITASVDDNIVDVKAGVASEPIQLGQDETQITIVVISGSAQQTYTLEVNRASQVLQQAYAKANHPGEKDKFGYAVSLSGDTLAVGAPDEDSGADGHGDSVTDSGAVYLFARSENGKWVRQYHLKAPNPEAGDNFGYRVSLSGDTLAVGAPYKDSAAGAVYVFTRSSNGTWSEGAPTKASSAESGDHFGWAISVSDDTLAVGTPFEDDDRGAVYVFTSSEEAWPEATRLATSNPNDKFGYAVSLSGDTLAVGTGNPDATVYIFTRTDTWSSEPYIIESDDLYVGYPLSLSGGSLAVGAWSSGTVYVFSRTMASTGTKWLLQDDPIEASNAGNGDDFGRAVSLSGDILAVGAPLEDSSATGIYYDTSFSDDDDTPNSGAVYLFQ